MSNETMQYHEMAAFIFLLFLVAKDRQTGGLFNDFEDQLESLPPDMPLPFKDFHRILKGVLLTVVDSPAHPNPDPVRRQKYHKLFNNAHLAIRDLFQAMASDALWEVCRPVDFEKIKSLAVLSLMDLEARPALERLWERRG